VALAPEAIEIARLIDLAAALDLLLPFFAAARFPELELLEADRFRVDFVVIMILLKPSI